LPNALDCHATDVAPDTSQHFVERFVAKPFGADAGNGCGVEIAAQAALDSAPATASMAGLALCNL
jgi:hypothetical protein